MEKTNDNPVEKPIDSKFLKALEKKGEANAKVIVKDFVKNGNVDDSMKSIQNVLQNGFNEFEKETGRKMTYSEMRDLYG